MVVFNGPQVQASTYVFTRLAGTDDHVKTADTSLQQTLLNQVANVERMFKLWIVYFDQIRFMLILKNETDCKNLQYSSIAKKQMFKKT